MYIVRRAIERIDDPAVFALDIDRGRVLFADKRMVGKAIEHFGPNGGLRREIGFGHEIGGAFFAHRETSAPVAEHSASGAGSDFGGFDKRVERGFGHGSDLGCF